MRDLIDELDIWRGSGKRAAIARVVEVEGSGPMASGAAMAVSEDGNVIGSVSGGCIEAAVVEAALGAIATGARARHSFGYSDDGAVAVGLTCGGTIHVFVEPFDWDADLYDELVGAVRGGHAVAVATVIAGAGTGEKLLVHDDGQVTGRLGDDDLHRVVARDAVGELAAGSTGARRYGSHGEAQMDDVMVFLETFAPPPHMVILGAIDFTDALVRVAKVLGYRVTVCDARPIFANRRRFKTADEVVVDWPHRLLDRIGPTLSARDAVVVLTHDHKFDIPAIVAALGTDVGYLGAMGSRRTQAERVAMLREAGVDEAGLTRLHGPIGLDLGARTPSETAVSICAEIIAERTGRTEARPLRSIDRPIHA